MAIYTGQPTAINQDIPLWMQQAQGVDSLHSFLEQALDPMRVASGVDLTPYMQGVNIAPGGMGTQTGIDQNIQAANTILSRLYAADPTAFRGGQFNPWGSFQDFNARQNQRSGFNEGSGIGDFIGSIPGELGRVGGELASERGVQGLALAAAGGSMMGGGAGAGTAGAGGTAAGGALPGNAALMSFGEPVTAAQLSSYGFSPSLLGATYGAVPAVAATPGASVPTAPGVGVSGPAAVVPPAAKVATSGLASALSSPVALGIGAGALMGGLGGSEQAGTTTTEEGLPDWLMPYVKPQLDRYSQELQNYNIDPYGVMPSAMKEFQNTISGQYLDPSTNKYLGDYFKAGAERIKGSLSPSFGHMQAFGAHSGYNEALARGLGDFSTGLYGGEYAKERDRQTQLTAAAPSFIGQSSQAAFAPYQQYLQSIGSLGRKKEEPFYENPFGNILGSAFVGGSLGNMFGGGKK